MPANEYYDSTGAPGYKGTLSSATMRAEFDAIEAGFNKLPVLAGQGGKVIKVNIGGTGLEPDTLDKNDVGLGNVANVDTTNASNITSGTLASARLSLTKSDVGLGNVANVDQTNASNITSGTLAMARADVTILIPPGAIMAWVGGYFTNGTNGGYTYMLGSANTIAAANAYLSPKGFRVCDGTAPGAISGSPIFTATGQYLPNLTDSRFLMGDTSVGATGGAASNAHVHSVGAHAHGLNSHYHSINPASTASGGPSTANTSSVAITAAQVALHTHPITDGGLVVSGTSIATGSGRGDIAGDAENQASGGGSHYHTLNSHTHSIDIAAFNSGNATGNTANSTAFDTGAAGTNENRPLFLACLYIMRVI